MKLRIVIACLVLICLLPLSPSISAQENALTPYLVKDINTQASAGSEVEAFIEAGDVSYMFMRFGDGQPGLWKTDGSPEGTIFLKSLYFNPGPHDEQLLPPELQPFGAALDGYLIFGACSLNAPVGMDDCELWKSDGTPEGTVLAADLAPGDSSSYPRNFVAVGGSVFFVTDQGLWRLDAPDAEAFLVLSIDYVTGNHIIGSRLFALGDRLYFSAKDLVHGVELWVSDGTPAGTTILMDLYPGQEGSYAVPLMAKDGLLYFAANNGYSGSEIWVFRQALGSLRIISDVNAYSIQFLSMVTKLGDRVFFRVCEPYTTTCKIFVSDSYVSRPLFDDQNPDAEPLNPQLVGEVSTPSGDRLLFFGGNENDVYRLYSTDGTEENTIVIYDEGLLPIPGGNSEPRRLIPEAEIFEGQLFFSSNHPTAGVDLLKSDGTPEGTMLLQDIRPGLPGSRPKFLGRCGAWLCFIANDGINGSELWRTGGTGESTILIGDLTRLALSSDPQNLVGIGEWVYFVADSGEGPGIWRTNGMEGNTERVWINPTNIERAPTFLTAVGNHLYFVTDDLRSGEEIWVHEVITGDTHLVIDIAPGMESASPRFLTPVGDLLFFVVEEKAFSRQLWRTDGTPDGTFMVTDASPGDKFSGRVVLVEHNGKLIFYASSNGGYNYDLWVSDGTRDGTRPFVSFETVPEGFAKARSLLFFHVYKRTDQTYSMWRTDGTAEGTKPIVRPDCINPEGYFANASTVGNRALWSSYSVDNQNLVILGSRGDTIECLASLPFDVEYTQLASDFYDFRGKGIFQLMELNEAQTHYRLLTWVTDGTQEGTHALSGDPGLIYKYKTGGIYLFMDAALKASGRELYIWDGSDSPSRLVADIYPGPESSSPGNFFPWNGKLFFSADDGSGGRELWALDLGLTPLWLPLISH